MKNIKDIVIGIFAVIGFAAIVTGFSNEAEQEHTVPESHVWVLSEAIPPSGASAAKIYALNKATGEVRFYSNAKRK